ncbi:MAG: alkaline phosphatase [Candidatus Komeilibacteria bacterium CG_4_10_14_0_2_um_filter_37_10]|uniref:Alkaline phosphatase n=1 Tax=Candidatus Komeilibacteria bacterium CG_4_10_14_0_2_um_filter_37_10 TaxID=1974470 RepID=A0A2M7VF02_9BACT|nr:MAG: alkaline phosphatase [Candidatus Komeilibacteria bacterium CG_4_10_14_0_2_um_filter_37_10]
MTEIIHFVTSIVTDIINSWHYFGVLFLMTLESANIPIPSEVILPYAGFLASHGQMNYHLAAIVGAFGCVIGGIISYYLGYILGRPFLMKHGKWLLISNRDIELVDHLLEKHGNAIYFVSRMLPVVRTYISIVVGISRGHFWKFTISGFIGSLIWCYILVFLGVVLGNNWNQLGPWWDKFNVGIIVLIIIGIAWHISRVFRKK